MHVDAHPLRVSATCGYCATVNQLVVASIPSGEEEVRCSLCGGLLGTLDELPRVDPAERILGELPHRRREPA
jgi:hypothetical protein